MGCIGVSALGLGMMRAASDFLINWTLTLVGFVLLIALVGAILSRGDPSWVGFSVFGLGYCMSCAYFSATASEERQNLLLPQAAANALAESLHATMLRPPKPPMIRQKYLDQVNAIILKDPFHPRFGGSDDTRLYEFLSGREHDLLDISMLNPSELAALKAYEANVKRHLDQLPITQKLRENCKLIGGAWMVLLVGLVGSITARLLANRFTKNSLMTAV